MVGTQLVTDFMGYIVDVEIIALGNAICRGSDAAAFAIDCSISVDTDTTDTAGIATTTGRTEHVSDIVVGFSHIGNKRIFQLHIPIGQCGIGVSTSIVIDNIGGSGYQVQVQGQVFFEDTVATGEGIVEGCKDQSYLSSTGSTEIVGVFSIAR